MSKGKGKRLTQDEKERIGTLFKEKKAVGEIAKEVGCSVPTVYNVLKAGESNNSVKRKPGRPTGVNKATPASGAGLGLNVREEIRRIVREEVQIALREAFK